MISPMDPDKSWHLFLPPARVKVQVTYDYDLTEAMWIMTGCIAEDPGVKAKYHFMKDGVQTSIGQSMGEHMFIVGAQ